MDNAVRTVGAQAVDDKRSVQDGTEEQAGVGTEPVSASARKVVEHSHYVATTLQRADNMRSDIAGPTGDQHSHCLLLSRSNLTACSASPFTGTKAVDIMKITN